MKVDGRPMRTIWLEPDGWSVGIIDQTALPHRFARLRLQTLDDAARAIRTMQVRGAPLIGAAAAYGVCLALRADPSDHGLERACAVLAAAAQGQDSEQPAAADKTEGQETAEAAAAEAAAFEAQLAQAGATIRAINVTVDNVFDPSPASIAGVQVGDVLQSINRQPIFTVYDFQKWTYMFGIGASVELGIVRKGKPMVLKTVIAERPANATTR